MTEWLRNFLKNQYVKAVLCLIILEILALYLGAPLNAVLAIFLIILWLGYIYLVIKKSTILLTKEKKMVQVIILILVVIALLTIKGFQEVLTLLFWMFFRNDIAIYIWFRAGKSFLTTALAHSSAAIIGLIIIYLTADLIKSHGERHGPSLINLLFKPIIIRIRPVITWVKKIIEEPHIKKIVNETKDIVRFLNELRQSYKKAIGYWIESKKLIWIFLIYLMPIPLPYLPTIIIITVRARNIRYGIWPLIIASFIKSFIFVWLFWQGLIRI